MAVTAVTTVTGVTALTAVMAVTGVIAVTAVQACTQDFQKGGSKMHCGWPHLLLFGSTAIILYANLHVHES